jgi:ribulose kinase
MYVIGIDGGTESIRAGVFDLAGRPLGFVATPYPTIHEQVGSFTVHIGGCAHRNAGETVTTVLLLVAVADETVGAGPHAARLGGAVAPRLVGRHGYFRAWCA